MRTAVEKALEELVDVVPAGVDGFYYQGQELKDKKCKEVEAFKGIDTLHNFNKITGQYVDLTREQFDLYNIEVAYEPNETMQREYCCKNPDTNARYRQLQRNIIAYLKNNED